MPKEMLPLGGRPLIAYALEEAARGGANLIPHILGAVESYATVGEIANVMRTVFGEYRETVTV